MTQPTKREQLAAMRLEDFKEHLRTIAGGANFYLTLSGAIISLAGLGQSWATKKQ
jgi:hypothetical protein